MTVIVWDGKTLAADQMGEIAGTRLLATKLVTTTLNGERHAIAWSGNQAQGPVMMQWFIAGAKPEDFPPAQLNAEKWARLVVATKAGAFYFEQTPIPIRCEEPSYAWGSGMDFALGALHMGANAVQAVEASIRWCTTCGYGVSSFTFGE